MTVKEFVTNYNKTKNIEKHIIKTYVPYAEKITLCTKILEITCYEKISEDEKIFKMNTPSRKMMFMLVLVDTYTDIDINFQNVLEDFDILSEKELLGAIIKAIPENEVTLFSSLLDMCLDDLITNTRDLIPWMENKIKASSIVINTVLESLINSEQIKPIIDSLGIGEVLPK